MTLYNSRYDYSSYKVHAAPVQLVSEQSLRSARSPKAGVYQKNHYRIFNRVRVKILAVGGLGFWDSGRIPNKDPQHPLMLITFPYDPKP